MLVGIALVAVGIVLVAYFTPHGHPPKKQEPAEVVAESPALEAEES